MYFQDVIGTLAEYWGSLGCVLLQPHDIMMGAGTFHPATVLRSLGPRPWRCAYVQPSRRPGDARYGDNPNRLGHFYQYQVLLKPAPIDVQDLYLGSLAAIGIDLTAHDMRFVEDDWASPTLGAWGLGWEVWMDGLEVSQFTYFQQVGGVACAPVPAELTYGLERLTMALQGVDDVFDIAWVEGVTYRDVFHRNEVEQSTYNFEQSDPKALFELFNTSFAECARLAEHGLAMPAYDQAIATSHTFNMLDARGAISVAERQQYIKRIRDLACRCAEAWVAHSPDTPHEPVPVAASGPAATVATSKAAPTGSRELVVEIGCEELPASYVRPALAALEAGVVGLVEGLDHGPVRTFATPRRLAVCIEGLQPVRASSTKLVLGPPAVRAFSDGEPTKVGLGFARGRGVDAADLKIVNSPRGQVVAAEIVEGGERAVELIAAGLDGVVRGLAFPKTMEWGTSDVRWARPIHRVNAVYDGVRIDGVAAQLPFGEHTDLHRLAEGRTAAFTGRADWLAALRAGAVEPDLWVREQQIRSLLVDATSTLGCDPIVDDELLEEVLHLVEAPTLVVGEFDAGLLELPHKLLVQTMRHHQRYFPVFRDGALSNDFVVISNNPWADAQRVAAGNARVLLARFDDAKFFFAEDRKQRLEARGDDLQRMRWIRGMGTMAHKQARVAALAEALAPHTGADPAVVARAGSLCKCDLVTHMVGEFPELQGHIGRLYADAQGEPEGVGLAIEESWLPAYASDAVANSPAGITLALADRLDTLASCFGIGLVPKGGDPQGLRRAALGVVRTAIEAGQRLDLHQVVGLAVHNLHAYVLAQPDGFDAWTKARGTDSTAATDQDAVVSELVAFILARFRASAIAAEVTTDVVDAVLATGDTDPVVLQAKVAALHGLSGNAEFTKIMITFKRVLNITRDAEYPAPPAGALTHSAERALHAAVDAVETTIAQAVAALDFGAALDAMLTLQKPVATLFDAVMVDSDDPTEKANRMGLLLRVGRTFLTLADFSRISTR